MPRYIFSAVVAPALLAAAWSAATTPAAAQQRALGLDISAWQGNISQTTWNNIRNVENRQFVFLRSSRGGTTGYYNQNDADNSDGLNTLSQRYDDPYFVQNITRATTAGMYAGSYHFSRPDIVADTFNSAGIANTGADEADHFIQMAGAWMRPGYLLPVHDLEAGDGIRSDNDMAQFAIDFSNRIYDVMGIRPAIYINGNYASNILQTASASLRTQVVAGYPVLWSARWPNQADPDSIPVQTGNPKDTFSAIYGPWDDGGVTHPWSFWQYASTGRLQSYNNGQSNLDFDVAKGGAEFLKDNLVPALWVTNASGDWSTMANWNSGQTPVAPVQGPGQVPRVGSLTLPTVRLPGANDTVILDRPSASIDVAITSGAHTIRKLYVRETFTISGGSLTINYTPSADSTPISAQFSAPAGLTGSGALSVHTLQVDAQRNFSLGGGTLTFNTINLMPHASAPAKIVMSGDVSFAPLAGAAATIANGAGAGLSGRIDLGAADRTFQVADGAATFDVTVNVPVTGAGGLAKAGPGTLVLGSANTYLGDTTVQAGKLRLAAAGLADAADVHVFSGGTLELGFAGTDIVDSLFIDGVSLPAGVWGAVGSGAAFTSPLLAGPGLLQVTTFVAPPISGDFNGDGRVDGADLVNWTTFVGTESGASAAHGDADGDGDVDGTDFVAWQQQLGAGVPAATAARVPEPSTGLLAAALAAMLLVLAMREHHGLRCCSAPRRR